MGKSISRVARFKKRREPIYSLHSEAFDIEKVGTRKCKFIGEFCYAKGLIKQRNTKHFPLETVIFILNQCTEHCEATKASLMYTLESCMDPEIDVVCAFKRFWWSSSS